MLWRRLESTAGKGGWGRSGLAILQPFVHFISVSGTHSVVVMGASLPGNSGQNADNPSCQPTPILFDSNKRYNEV